MGNQDLFPPERSGDPGSVSAREGGDLGSVSSREGGSAGSVSVWGWAWLEGRADNTPLLTCPAARQSAPAIIFPQPFYSQLSHPAHFHFIYSSLSLPIFFLLPYRYSPPSILIQYGPSFLPYFMTLSNAHCPAYPSAAWGLNSPIHFLSLFLLCLHPTCALCIFNINPPFSPSSPPRHPTPTALVWHISASHLRPALIGIQEFFHPSRKEYILRKSKVHPSLCIPYFTPSWFLDDEFWRISYGWVWNCITEKN